MLVVTVRFSGWGRVSGNDRVGVGIRLGVWARVRVGVAVAVELRNVVRDVGSAEAMVMVSDGDGVECLNAQEALPHVG